MLGYLSADIMGAFHYAKPAGQKTKTNVQRSVGIPEENSAAFSD